MLRHELASLVLLALLACEVEHRPRTVSAPVASVTSPAATIPMATAIAEPPKPTPRAQLDELELVVLDPRPSRTRPRATALLVVEIQQLELLLQASSPPSKDRPAILRRLAEEYVELENATARDRPPTTHPRSVIDRARKTAGLYYERLIAEYPDRYTKIDEVFYYLAYEYEAAGDDASARRVYLELIARSPESPYVSKAYFMLGWLYASEAAPGDTSASRSAEDEFAKAAASADPRVVPVALRRLAWAARLAGDSRVADEASGRLGSMYATSEAARSPL
jgi:tetratricopeptide (TPR) repeat protein